MEPKPSDNAPYGVEPLTIEEAQELLEIWRSEERTDRLLVQLPLLAAVAGVGVGLMLGEIVRRWVC